jgi:hypothetical protein
MAGVALSGLVIVWVDEFPGRCPGLMGCCAVGAAGSASASIPRGRSCLRESAPTSRSFCQHTQDAQDAVLVRDRSRQLRFNAAVIGRSVEASWWHPDL